MFDVMSIQDIAACIGFVLAFAVGFVGGMLS